MSELTDIEQNAIYRLEKAFRYLPKTLVVYVVDDVAVVCKKGISSYDIRITVGSGLSPTNMLTDVHDDMNYGKSEARDE